MQSRWILPGLLCLMAYVPAAAQGTGKVAGQGLVSYFTAGFAILFCAVFLFSFCLKTILNQKAGKWSTKQIVISSVRWALIVAVLLLTILYLFLKSGR